jgi:hypothetical protein
MCLLSFVLLAGSVSDVSNEIRSGFMQAMQAGQSMSRRG